MMYGNETEFVYSVRGMYEAQDDIRRGRTQSAVAALISGLAINITTNIEEKQE